MATEESVAEGSEAETPQEIAQAHEALLADGSYQFEVEALPQQTTPEWLRRILESDLVDAILKALGWFLQFAFYAGLVILAVLLCYFLYRAITSRLPSGEDDETSSSKAYAPSESVVRDLLAEADALAAERDYAGAARLLLQRSIEDVARSRPGTVSRAMTAREIGALGILTDATRDAYAFIATLVERAHFAGLPISGSDYDDARERYGIIGRRRST
ncbi:MAG: hypothetical protein AAF830_03125 [Pseudomonadota bacterium]